MRHVQTTRQAAQDKGQGTRRMPGSSGVRVISWVACTVRQGTQRAASAPPLRPIISTLVQDARFEIGCLAVAWMLSAACRWPIGCFRLLAGGLDAFGCLPVGYWMLGALPAAPYGLHANTARCATAHFIIFLCVVS